MADSVRQDIIDALGIALATITTVNGYVTNVGNSIFEWRAFAFDDALLPALTYRDTDDPIEVTHNYALHKLRIEILFAAAGTTSPATVRNVIADVNKCIFAQKTASQDTYFSGLVLDIVPIESPMDADQADKKIAGAKLAYDFYFLTPKLSSYLT